MTTNRDAFDAIAPTWYGVRHWPLLPHELKELAVRWQHGTLVNLGCGAGSDFLPFSGHFEMVGLDCSRGMLVQALRHMSRHGTRASLIQGDLSHLPFADESFDYAIGVACYHHIEGASARKMAFAELKRILRPQGEAFLSVWNHAQPRFSELPQDQQVPFRHGTTAVERYYHLFTADELEAVLRQSGFETVSMGCSMSRQDRSLEDSRNICALVRRATR